MSKALRTVAVIAGSVALIATGVGAAAGAKGLTIAGASISAKTLATVATVATITSGVAGTAAQLTAPKPTPRGSPAQVVIDIEPPRPYAVGEVMVGGTIRYDNAYGPTEKRVPNPLRWQVRVMSGVGPIEGFVSDNFDFAPINTGFYTSNFLGIAKQVGNRPESSALTPPLGGSPPAWNTNSKLSGCAAVGLNLRFDRDGERYASGFPLYTSLLRGEKVYDPRLDSTFPGGSGPCRAGDESTYVYSRNPACHAATYALGRFQNGKRLFGMGQSVDTIDWPAVVDWANDCDANEWTANMVLSEGGTGSNLRDQRVRNLDDLCAAGGGRWYQAGGLLSFDWHRPRVSLATLRDEDILEAGGGTDAVQTVRDRMNGVRPQYVSPAHNWQQITAAEIVGSTYLAEDGTSLTQVYPLNGVTNAKQAGQLATYAMADSRELGPMDIQAKVVWRFYRPGDCIDIDSSLVAYSGQAVINQRGLNPETLAVALSLKSETPGKHPFALGKVADPPPTPVLAQTPEERDLLASAALRPRDVDAEEGSTKGATLLDAAEYDPTIGVVGNIFDSAGDPRKPGEVLNTEIELTPDGRLRYFELPTLPAIELGALTLPDLGAASDEALRRAQDDTEALARAVSTALENVSTTRETLRDAGFYVDEATGQVRIFAIDQTNERVGTAEIRLNAAEANINLRATFDYVDQSILEAVLDPSQIADLDTVFLRLTAAELDIDAINGTITTLATNTQLSAVEGRVTVAESAINALEGTIVNKVDNTTFNALDSRVTSAENTLAALGDVAQFTVAVTALRAVSREQDDTTANNLLGLLLDDKTRRDQVTAIASARQDLTARIIEGEAAEASARLALQAQVQDAEASIIQESVARANADSALATQINNLTTTVNGNTAAIQNEALTRSDADSALAGQISSVSAVANARNRTFRQNTAPSDPVTGDLWYNTADDNKLSRWSGSAWVATDDARIAQNIAAITQESIARADGDTALAGQISSLSTTVSGNTATINQFASSINGLEARWGVTVDVNGRVGGFVLNNGQSTVDAIFLADRFSVINPSDGQPFLDSAPDGLRLRNGRIIMDNGAFIRATGVGFGTSSQFIEWFGPRPAGGDIALCSEANAISYLKTNGDAFFGGALSAGTLKNQAQSTSIQGDAFVTIGPFGTNGNPKQVVTSYAIESQASASYPATVQGANDWDAAVIAWGIANPGNFVDSSKAVAADVSIVTQRQIGTASPTNFSSLVITSGTETINGIRPTPGDAPGGLLYTRTASGSVTATDNVAGTDNRTFTATIMNRDPNVINGSIISQRLTLISTEQ